MKTLIPERDYYDEVYHWLAKYKPDMHELRGAFEPEVNRNIKKEKANVD